MDSMWVRRYLGEAAKGAHPAPSTYNYQYATEVEALTRAHQHLKYFVRGIDKLDLNWNKHDYILVDNSWLQQANEHVVESWEYLAPALKKKSPDVVKIAKDLKAIIADVHEWMEEEGISKRRGDQSDDSGSTRLDTYNADHTGRRATYLLADMRKAIAARGGETR